MNYVCVCSVKKKMNINDEGHLTAGDLESRSDLDLVFAS